jgi:glucose-1-phosphate cytidylyltransferase
MKCVILAGGAGTRLREETEFIPKPMVLIGNKPMIWHIMKTYSYYGFNDFIICLGYKGEIIRDYFVNYARNNNDCTVCTASGDIQFSPIKENWKVTLVDTGLETQTGGRIKRVKKYLTDGIFMATYGDGLADINIQKLLLSHGNINQYATLTGVLSKSRFGELEIDSPKNSSLFKIQSFKEKSNTSWINGGYFVFNDSIVDYIEGDHDPLEGGLFSRLTERGLLAMYEHRGFWQCMDTYKETLMLNELWNNGLAPWKVWKD